MLGKFKVITVCGSTKYKKEFEDLCKRLELEYGYLVLRTSIFSHTDGINLTEIQEENCIGKYKEMMKISDEIAVCVVNGYIGKHTKTDIDYAKSIGKKVRYYCYDPGVCNSTVKTDDYYFENSEAEELQLRIWCKHNNS